MAQPENKNLRLLIRVVDSHNDDPKLDAEASKAGDVISILRPHVVLGEETLKNPDWRVVELQTDDIGLLEDLMRPEVKIDKESMDIVRFRATRIALEDIAHIVAKMEVNKDGVAVLSIAETADLISAKRVKPKGVVRIG